ncbi:protein angel isoform X1 [Leptopilina heterotoma]|uniref:protein angel isoform X1 n=2 Tax=Leptopilina heterotoma TaxID=63436 RepID=UPI001CA8009E|nr:protein angel isoform X1 [Leptopilina heterotoma]
MNVTTRFLNKSNVFCRNIHSALLHQELKIVHMTEVPLKHLFIKNLRKSASVPEALYSTYVNLVDTIASPGSHHQELNKSLMEPYLDLCYIPKEVPPASNYDFSFESCSSVGTSNESISSMFTQNMDLTKTAEQDGNLGNKRTKDMQRYKTMRKWKRFGKLKQEVDPNEAFVLRLMSFNILAQSLLELHPYLYKYHDIAALPWKVRKPIITQEILQAEANVICLQEMQEDHLDDFLVPFKEQGYDYFYKKRTNDKDDGLLLMYRTENLTVVDYTKVEMFQSEVELLNRDNVGIIVKFALKDSPETQFVIATTHLLYNPRRSDVRLGQVQVLLTEIERIAFIENTMTGPKYLPIILCGDFNLEPHTGVYKFITQGLFTYQNKGRNLEPQDYRYLSNVLLPPSLHITDDCQHFNVLLQRLRGGGRGQVMLENRENHKNIRRHSTEEIIAEDVSVNTFTNQYQQIQLDENNHVKFSSGTLTHPFKFRSAYKHKNRHGYPEATTHQNNWITVDYIFFSGLEPLGILSLPTVEQCNDLPTIPNFAVGSDHLCLAASFKVLKKKRSNL